MATVKGEIDLRRRGDHVVVLAMNAQRLVLLVFSPEFLTTNRVSPMGETLFEHCS